MKKSILMLLATTSCLLAACGGGEGGGEGGGGSVTGNLKIRFHVDSKSKEGIAYKKLIDAFNAENSKNGLTVNPLFVARTAGDSAYERQLATDKLEGTLPDIITFDAPNCAAYAEAGYLYDFTNELSAEDKAQYVTLNQYQGKVYGIPIQESSAGFYYNKKILDQAGVNVSGITVDNPWTFSEFKAACEKIKNIGKIPVDMRYSATKDETATYLLYPFIYAAGGRFLNDEGTTATGYFDSVKSINGFQFLKDILTSGYTSYGINDGFPKGNVGFFLSSGWTIDEIKNEWTDTFKNESEWGLLPYPKGEKTSSANGSWCFAIGNNGRTDKAAVVKLLKYLTSKDSSKAITDATGMIPANKEVEIHVEPGSPESVLYDQLQKTSETRPATVCYPQFSSAFSQVISGLGEGDLATLVRNKAAVLQKHLDEANKK